MILVSIYSIFISFPPFVSSHLSENPDNLFFRFPECLSDWLLFSLTRFMIETGSFSCLRGRFRLTRNVGNFIVSRYIPSFLIVLLTFTGFWIPMHAYPARVGLCITGLLSLITQQYQNVLNVSYVYSLNVWMMMCIVFVFGTIIEYAFAISDWADMVVLPKGKYVVSSPRETSSTGGEGDPKNNSHRPQEVYTDDKSAWKDLLLRLFNPTDRNNTVDMISRIMFPSAFLLFTIIYFCIYVWG